MQCEASLRKLDLSLGIHDNGKINEQSGKFFDVEILIMASRGTCIRPSLVSPPTSVTIQSGMARAATAKMSAARNSAPEIKLSLSIIGFSFLFIPASTVSVLK